MAEANKKCTLTLPIDWPAPKQGEYLVTFGKKGLLSVWVIATARAIRHKVVSDEQGYALTAYDRPDLKEVTEWEDRPDECRQAWVRGEDAIACFRTYPEKKKH